VNPLHPKAVIFDFDYTLADSTAPAYDCAGHALTAMGLQTPPKAVVATTIGLSLTEAFHRMFPKEDRALAAEYYRLFIKRADEVMVDGTVLFDWTPRAISALHAHGMPLGIVSTKGRFRIEAILGRERLLDRFETIVGGEDVPAFKPDPHGLLAALRRLDVPKGEALYVGDSLTYAETAKRARVPFMAVLSGTTKRDEFNGYPVVEIIPSVAELPARLGW